MSDRRGKFISFEGGDGSGKSTQIGLTRDWLLAEGYDVLLTREPGGTRIGEKIREILLDPQNTEMTDMTEMLLYAAARAQLAREVITPAVAAGELVLCDRWADSSYVYQAAVRGLGEAVFEVNAYAGGEVIFPDVTILLDMDASEALKRAKASGSGKHDRIEALGEEWHKQIREAYLALAARYPDRIYVVDAAGSAGAVNERIRAILTETLETGV